MVTCWKFSSDMISLVFNVKFISFVWHYFMPVALFKETVKESSWSLDIVARKHTCAVRPVSWLMSVIGIGAWNAKNEELLYMCIYKGYQQRSVPVTTWTRNLPSNFFLGQCQSTILCYMQSKQYFHINDTWNMYLPQTHMTEFCTVCPEIQQKSPVRKMPVCERSRNIVDFLR